MSSAFSQYCSVPESAFTFYNRPRISFVSPSCGHVEGGTEIIIGGQGIIETNAISVKFTSLDEKLKVVVNGRVVE